MELDEVFPKQEKKNKEKQVREFNMDKYNRRHIALKIAYIGYKYLGFASQENVKETVEEYLFEALKKVRLITERDNSNYSRCGRTDKGVSAIDQVVALYLRSNVSEGLGVIPSTSAAMKDKKDNTELQYASIINRVLPDDIRVLAWAPVPLDFSARFSCLYRTYKYFFTAGDMDIPLMKEAAQKFVGEHDFRHFCKLDVVNVKTFTRNILSFDIEPVNEHSSSNPRDNMYAFVIKGSAFLWHQVRCMVAVLFLIGQHKEEPSLIDELLNVEKDIGTPEYAIASEVPLVLWECGFKDIQWNYDIDAQRQLEKHFTNMWNEQRIKSSIISLALKSVQNAVVTNGEQTLPWKELSATLPKNEPKYVKFSNRQKRPSVEYLQQTLSETKRKKCEKNEEKAKMKRAAKQNDLQIA